MKHESYTLTNRLLHWALAFSMLFILLTIFLRLYWLNRNNIAAILLNRLSELDVSISDMQASSIARAIRKPMWDWHIYIGYVITGLYAIRLVFFTIQSAVFKSPFSKDNTLKEKFKSWIYTVYYIFLGVTLITGLLIVLGPDSYRHTFELIHKLSLYWLLAFIVIHFGGFLLEELSTEKGIVSKMISGNEITK